MKQFSLEKYLENPSRKVVTRQGKSVRIICTDRRHTDNWPIVALEDYEDGEFVIYANIDGRTDMCSENIHDLFFADEEEELTQFEKAVRNILARYISNIDCFPETIKSEAESLLDLTRKELLKDLPKWKKTKKDNQYKPCIIKCTDYTVLEICGYEIRISELFEKLPKEE